MDNAMSQLTRSGIVFGLLLAVMANMLPTAAASAAPCDAVTYAEAKLWEPKTIIATFCADQAEADRLATVLTTGTPLRRVVDETQAKLDICEEQTKMFQAVLLEKLGRRMPECSKWP